MIEVFITLIVCGTIFGIVGLMCNPIHEIAKKLSGKPDRE